MVIHSSEYRQKCIHVKGEACDICNSPEDVVHHIDGDRSNNNIENLVPLCNACHGKVHRAVDPSGDIAVLQEKLLPREQRMSERSVAVSMSPELLDAVEGQLGYGDSRAAWIRGAVRDRLDSGVS